MGGGARLGRAVAVAGLAALLLGASLAAGGGTSRPGAAPVEAQIARQLAKNGHASFWVVLRGKADLTSASGIRNRSRRGVEVYERLTSYAHQSQAPLKAWLEARGITYQSYWIVNAVFVKSADGNQLDAIAARPDVKLIRANHSYPIPKDTPARSDASPATTEWGLNAINAPQVWSTFNDRGEGIVISSIDTGVRYSHAALVGHYRGNLRGGNFDHNYNWLDPLDECPTEAPCDTDTHGTHTMGTMVGDDGDPGTNQIGVAPHATWILAKGCCLDTALIASGQWILAPTDSTGQNPRPDLRPDIVNNSWGGGSGDPFFQPEVQAWVAAGIFPAFSNGNEGPACGTAGSPGDLPETYAAGAFAQNGTIAGFSSRGPSAFGGIIKPNIAAPGVAVRSSSSSSDTSYVSLSGTSMASPHVAGAVALIWSISPELRGDIERTEQLLDQTATDTDNVTCGGTPADNNVWGEGKLNALAAVTAAPKGPTGTLSGTVSPTDTT